MADRPCQPNAAGLGQGELKLLTLPNPPGKAGASPSYVCCLA